jgi:hypothetical protein
VHCTEGIALQEKKKSSVHYFIHSTPAPHDQQQFHIDMAPTFFPSSFAMAMCVCVCVCAPVQSAGDFAVIDCLAPTSSIHRLLLLSV